MNIKDWALEDRPREKLYAYGAKKLTNAELLAIVLSSGTKSKSALELAKDILAIAENNLDRLAMQEVGDLCRVKGIGYAKAVTIKAVMELANRRDEQKENRRKITCSQDAFQELKYQFLDLKSEEFWVLYMNRANRVIGKECVSKGSVTATLVDPKLIFKSALSMLATGILLSHNHPSGNLKPSRQDLELTKKIAQAAKSLDINLLDHLILAGNTYYSFKDEGDL